MDVLLQEYPWLNEALTGIWGLTWLHVVMWAIGLLLIYLAVRHRYEPLLLLPIGFGAILVNIPPSLAMSVIWNQEGYLWELYRTGISSELFPILLLIAAGAACDFTPLFRRPSVLLVAAAAQCGIFVTVVAAAWTGFSFEHAAAVGIIGAADGPTTIYVGHRLAEEYLGPLALATYSYLALVPVLQPPLARLLTTTAERKIRMNSQSPVTVSRSARILFPILVAVLAGLVAPNAVSLIGSLMFGNLLRESGVTDGLAQTAQNELANLVTLLLGVAIGGTMLADRFLTADVALIMGLGAIAFIADTVGGVLFARFFNRFSRHKLNPLLGACGIAAFPLSGRVMARLALAEDPANDITQAALAVNAAGRVASVVAGGLVLALVSVLAK